MTGPIIGTCGPGFEPVADAFARNFAERGEVGASVCVMLGGEVVVDLAGGWADEAQTRPFGHDTLVNHYSVGKAFVALLALQLVDVVRLGLDDPIATVWPEFAAAGKGGVTLRQALCHRAGVPAIREPLTNDDLWNWDRMASALAATEPWWEPGTRHAYHTNTYGYLIGEVVRRVTGQMPGERLRAVCEPLGADVWCGLPTAEQERCADVIWAPSAAITGATPTTAGSGPHGLEGEALMIALGYTNPPGFSSMGVVNTPEWRGAQIPSTNGHSTARGIARLYGALLARDGRTGLLSEDLLVEATRPQSIGYCPYLGEEATFGLGFKPNSARRPFSPFSLSPAPRNDAGRFLRPPLRFGAQNSSSQAPRNDAGRFLRPPLRFGAQNSRSFGHFGTGGAVGFADPDTGVAFGYVMNHVIPRWQSSRNRALIDTFFRCLGAGSVGADEGAIDAGET